MDIASTYIEEIKRGLTVDYDNITLNHGEYPNEVDIKYLYITLNLTILQISNILNISKHKLGYYISKLNLHKTSEQISSSRAQAWQMTTDYYKQQRSNKIKEVFHNWSDEKRESFRNKIRLNNSNLTEEQKKKRIEKFKETWYNASPEKQKERRENNSRAQKNRTKESKQLSIEKARIKFKATWEKKTLEEKRAIKQKEFETRKRNGDCNISKIEESCYIELTNMFSIVYKQYYSEKYPFNCDFYIPSKDLYIELNFHWTHGGMPFELNESCQEQLQKWEEKARLSDFYKNAIQTWTIRDVKKTKFAKESKINYKVFYNYTEFKTWLLKEK